MIVKTSSGSTYRFQRDGTIVRASDREIPDKNTSVFVRSLNPPEVGEHLYLFDSDGQYVVTTRVMEVIEDEADDERYLGGRELRRISRVRQALEGVGLRVFRGDL